MAEEGFFEGTKKGVVMMKVSKEEKELFEIVRKIKPEQWKALHGFMGEAKDIIQSGGLTSFFKSELMNIKDDLISMIVDPILAPILEELSPVIADILEDVIPTIQDLTPVLKELAKGLAKAIAVLKATQVQLPGGDQWEPFWSGTIATFEKLIASIESILSGDPSAMDPYLSEYEWFAHYGGPGFNLPDEEEYSFY